MARSLKGSSMAETRSAIVDLLRSNGTISRAELAKASGLTPAAISKIIRPLIVDGLVSEVGFADSTGGKRAVLLELNSTARYSVGISVDTARNIYVLTDLAGTPIERFGAPGLGSSSPTEAIARIADDLTALLERAEVAIDDVVGVGVAGEGRISSTTGVLRSTRVPTQWDDFSVQDALGSVVPLPVVVDNDANCAALGEFWSGRVPTERAFATVWMATGIGFGIIVDGDVYRGASSNAGEIGHVILDVNGPECWCGSRGCLEILAAPFAVVRRAFEMPALRARLDLHETVDHAVDTTDVRTQFARIAKAAALGDPDAVPLIRQSADYLAKALISVVNLLDLDLLYLAGPGFADAGPIYLDVVRDELARYSFLRAAHGVAVEMSAVGLDAAALGAASSALHNHLTPHHVSGRD